MISTRIKIDHSDPNPRDLFVNFVCFVVHCLPSELLKKPGFRVAQHALRPTTAIGILCYNEVTSRRDQHPFGLTSCPNSKESPLMKRLIWIALVSVCAACSSPSDNNSDEYPNGDTGSDSDSDGDSDGDSDNDGDSD